MRYERKKGLGGTDIAAIVGLNPWKGPMDVYLDKLGLIEDQEDNEAMYWGREMEPVLQRRYEKETDRTVLTIAPLCHPIYPWYLGSPDGVIGHIEPFKYLGGVDYKTTGRRHDYGEAGTDQVPDYVACQCHWYMGLTGAEWWDVAVLFFTPRREFAIYHLKRNQNIINRLTKLGQDFWKNHILTQTPPPLDSSEATRRYLNDKYPLDRGDMLPAPEIALEWFSRLQDAREQIGSLEKAKILAEVHLKEIIGDAAGLQGDGWRCTWKKTKDRTETDWQKSYFKLCEYCRDSGLFINDEDFSGQFTTIKPGPRVFRVYEKKEE